jgi:hypothetical protein
LLLRWFGEIAQHAWSGDIARDYDYVHSIAQDGSRVRPDYSAVETPRRSKSIINGLVRAGVSRPADNLL